MDSGLVVMVLIIGAALFAIILLLFAPSLGLGGHKKGSGFDNLLAAQRGAAQKRAANRQGSSQGGPTVFDEVNAQPARKRGDSSLTLAKRLKFGRWPFPVLVFHVLEVLISLIAFLIVQLKMGIVLQIVSLLSGPLFMRWLLNLMVERRFKRFDSDYPQFLLSLIGLLKTGMNPMSALEAAAYGLEEGSLVKHEVELMLERLRFGISEDKSIGSFGEDIFHPEIELFVQALLLSRRVGGTLSDTLDRLAKQVRKRQYFRAQANAAVGMQRGSIWFIIGILCFVEVYVYFIYPQAVIGAWENEIGWMIWQGGIFAILLGIFWVRQITKLKV